MSVYLPIRGSGGCNSVHHNEENTPKLHSFISEARLLDFNNLSNAQGHLILLIHKPFLKSVNKAIMKHFQKSCISITN